MSDVRKVGANYEEHQQETGLEIPVDLVHFKKFPVVDPPGTYKKEGHVPGGTSIQATVSNCRTTAGRSTQHLRFSDFSNDALINMLGISDEYYRVCIEGWADSVAERYGHDDMRRIQAEAWRTRFFPDSGG